MKPLILSAAFLSLATATVAGADIRDIDVNGDRFITYSEFRQTAPGLSRADFAAMDQNGDRRVSANELSGARALAIVSRLPTRRSPGSPDGLRLAPANLGQIDSDRDGRVSFEELLRQDAPSLTMLRGN